MVPIAWPGTIENFNWFPALRREKIRPSDKQSTSFNDEPSIAHAMFEMYGYIRPYFFVN